MAWRAANSCLVNGELGMILTSYVRETLILIPIVFRVLTQGTGGVSIFGVQFAKAAGARVIATTSSNEKGEKLKQLGADHVINYKEDSNWGETAKKLTGGSGVQHVIEVGGPNTVKQSLKAIAIDGVITIIGFLGGVKGDEPSFVECLNNVCTVRGVLVGSRMMFEQMNRAVSTLIGGIFGGSLKHSLILLLIDVQVEANNIKPLIDQKTFKLEEAKEAYQVGRHRSHLTHIHILTSFCTSTCGIRSTSASSVSASSRYTSYYTHHTIVCCSTRCSAIVTIAPRLLAVTGGEGRS